jgi:hypothetical protein
VSRHPRFLADLTPAMSQALTRCYATLILIDAQHGISPRTLIALTRRQLLQEARDKRARRVWKPTSLGVSILTADEPRLLAAQSQRGYTTEPWEALPDEPEAIDNATLEDFAARNQARHQARQAQRPLDERLRELLDDQARGVSVSRNDLAAIERRIQAAERKRAA